MKVFSAVVPILNMAPFVERVAESLTQGPFGESLEEIIFVCDKSTDGTEQRILDLQKKQPPEKPKIVLIQPEVKRGHFQARYLGAKAARSSKIFFIDARVTLNEHALQVLPELAKKYPAMCANLDIDVNANIFCLYWKRSHEAIFARTFKANLGVNVITPENYDQMRIGTTCFFCSREAFLKVCEQHCEQMIYSDDTFVQKKLVALEPITVHPEFRIWWQPRSNAKAFLKHLYARGPGFAEYHIFTRRGWLFYAFISGLLFSFLELALLFWQPMLALGAGVGALLLMASTTALMAKSVSEFLRLAPLHTASMVAYGIGAIRGVWMVWKARRSEAAAPEGKTESLPEKCA